MSNRPGKRLGFSTYDSVLETIKNNNRVLVLYTKSSTPKYEASMECYSYPVVSVGIEGLYEYPAFFYNGHTTMIPVDIELIEKGKTSCVRSYIPQHDC